MVTGITCPTYALAHGTPSTTISCEHRPLTLFSIHTLSTTHEVHNCIRSTPSPHLRLKSWCECFVDVGNQSYGQHGLLVRARSDVPFLRRPCGAPTGFGDRTFRVGKNGSQAARVIGSFFMKLTVYKRFRNLHPAV